MRSPAGSSTRGRLTVAAAIVIAAVLAVESVATVLALRHTLLSAVDAAAHDDALDVAARVSAVLAAGTVDAPEPDAVVQVVGPDGRVVARSAHAPPQPLV